MRLAKTRWARFVEKWVKSEAREQWMEAGGQGRPDWDKHRQARTGAPLARDLAHKMAGNIPEWLANYLNAKREEEAALRFRSGYGLGKAR